jgi:DNA-binding transcriptional MerR regulator
MNSPGVWLIHSAIGGGLLLLLAWLFVRFALQPSRRQRLAEVGLFAALLLAVLSLAPAWLTVDWPVRAERAAAAIPAPSQADSSRAPLSSESPPPDEGTDPPIVVARPPAGAEDPGLGFDLSPSPPVMAAVPGELQAIPHAPAPPEPPADKVHDSESIVAGWLGWLVSAYVVGVTLFLLHWLVGRLALWRMLRTAVPAPADLRDRLLPASPAARIRLLLSDRLRIPMSCGLFRPAIVIPRNLCGPGHERRLRWVVAHELTHVGRRDAWTSLLFNLGRVVYFYLPWFWWLRRQVRLCQEYVADRAAIPPEEAADYAQFLLSLTRAPALPIGATGVLGSTSDLYRRISMLLKPDAAFERRGARFWAPAAVCSLLALAVVFSGIGLRSYVVAAPPEVDKKDAPKDEPKKDAPKDEPKKDAGDAEKPAAPADADQIRRDLEKIRRQQADELRKLMEKLRTDPNDADQIRKDIEKLQKEQTEEMRKQMEKLQEAMRARFGPPGGFAPANPFRGQDGFGGGIGNFGVGGMAGRTPHEGRMGILIREPDPTLVEQLDLPKGQGLIVDQVTKDSAAAKAGIKAHDILLEVNGKAVPDSASKFVKMLADIKADQKVDAVVLRKGKKETIKDLTLPESKAGKDDFDGNPFAPGAFPPDGIKIQVPNIEIPPILPGAGGLPPGPPGGIGGVRFPAGANAVMTTSMITGDRFTTRHQEGSLIITVSGSVTDGKAKTTEIQVQDGNKTEKYESVDKVPEAYKDKVKNLVDMSEKTKIKIEIKTP